MAVAAAAAVAALAQTVREAERRAQERAAKQAEWALFEIQEAARDGVLEARLLLDEIERDRAPIMSTIKGEATQYVDSLAGEDKGILDRISGALRDGLGAVGDAVGGAAGAVKDRLGGALGAVRDAVSAGLGVVAGALSAVGAMIADAMSGLAGLILQGISAIMMAAFTAVGRGIIEGMTAQGFGMPFAQGIGVGEGMAKSAPEVVKRGSPEIRAGFERATQAMEAELVTAIDAQIAELEKKHSPVTPAEAYSASLKISGAGLATWVGLTAASSAIEAASLGQLEVPGSFMLSLAGAYGLVHVVGAPVLAAYRWGVERGLNYHFAQRFTPAIPSERSIVEMLSRYRITPERAAGLMRFHGYAAEYDSWWEELAKTPLRYFAMMAIARAGFYDRDFFDIELKRSGYGPEAIEYLHRAMQNAELNQEVREAMGILRRHAKEGFITIENMLVEFERYRDETDIMKRQAMAARWEYDYDHKSDIRAMVLERFRRGAIDRARAFSELSEIMPEAARVNVLISREELKIRVAAEAVKMPSRADLARWLKKEIITIEAWRELMLAIGYQSPIVSLYELELTPREGAGAGETQIGPPVEIVPPPPGPSPLITGIRTAGGRRK